MGSKKLSVSVYLKGDEKPIRVSYAEQGDQDGIPVIFLHGLGLHKGWFQRLIFPFLPRSVRAIAIDLPGFGSSSYKHDGDYSIAWLSEVVIGFMDALGIHTCNLFGMSTGAVVSLCTAVHFPGRVSSVSVQGLPVLRKLEWPVLWRFLVRIARLGFRWHKKIYKMPGIMKAIYGLAYRTQDLRRVPLSLIAEGKMSLGASSGYWWGVINFDLLGHLSKIKVPVLAMDGDSVENRMADGLKEIEKSFPNVQTLRITDAGHLATFVAPENVTDILISFLDNIFGKRSQP